MMVSSQVQNVTAPYIMKCDDDTFIRVESILKQMDGVSLEQSLYMGNLNLRHRPLRTGKWAVTWEVQWLVVLCLYKLLFVCFRSQKLHKMLNDVCLIYCNRSGQNLFILLTPMDLDT